MDSVVCHPSCDKWFEFLLYGGLDADYVNKFHRDQNTYIDINSARIIADKLDQDWVGRGFLVQVCGHVVKYGYNVRVASGWTPSAKEALEYACSRINKDFNTIDKMWD